MPEPVATSATERLVLVLPDGGRVPVDAPLTIGRDAGANVRIPSRTVSRRHARITLGSEGPVIEDAGSRFGTTLSGESLSRPMRLRPGAVIVLGDVRIRVELADPPSAPAGDRELGPGPAETIVVPVNATMLGLRPAPLGCGDSDAELRPRIRSGWALKRLDRDEGEARFVLQDLRTRTFRRMEPEDAALFELLDGTRTVPELLRAAELLLGPSGPLRLSRLVSDLTDRGLIAGIDPLPVAGPRPNWSARVFRPRERTVTWTGDCFERAYHNWGRVLFHPLGVTALALYALSGFGAFSYLVGARYGTPFVVANRLAIGGAVFLAGRLALVAVHEMAHGLALAHYRRRAERGGIRLLLLFPYAFVDTSEAYFEPRTHRMVITAAGPISDLTMGATFSLACALWPAGSLRDVFFQLAFGGYVGAFFNLNPFVDRDGYNMLVDFLREPRLRQRARHHLRQRMSGARVDGPTSSVLGRYAVAGLVWSAIGATLAVIFANRYYERLERLLPTGVTLPLFLALYVALFLPVLAQLGVPVLRRMRFGREEVNRVVD